MGEVTADFNGDPFCIPCDYKNRVQAYDLKQFFDQNQVCSNRVQNGCIMQDGSIHFTAPSPDKPIGNKFCSDFEYFGKRYHLEAIDFAQIFFGKDGKVNRVVTADPYILNEME